jgi:hypothetical protein
MYYLAICSALKANPSTPPPVFSYPLHVLFFITLTIFFAITLLNVIITIAVFALREAAIMSFKGTAQQEVFTIVIQT